jgi:hypothetical protein
MGRLADDPLRKSLAVCKVPFAGSNGHTGNSGLDTSASFI